MLALIDPLLVPNEAEFSRKNTFRMVFHDFDWTAERSHRTLTELTVQVKVEQFKVSRFQMDLG